MEHQNNQLATENKTVIVRPPKSIGLAILLAFLFGPLGMLYSTVSGAIIMFVISVVVAFLALGFGLVFTWFICIIWSVLAASKTKK